MREMEQSAWLSTSFLAYREERGRVNARKALSPVTTGYHEAIIILFNLSPAEGTQTLRKSRDLASVPCCDFPARLLQVISHTRAGYFARMMTQRRSAKTNPSRVTISPV